MWQCAAWRHRSTIMTKIIIDIQNVGQQRFRGAAQNKQIARHLKTNFINYLKKFQYCANMLPLLQLHIRQYLMFAFRRAVRARRCRKFQYERSARTTHAQYPGQPTQKHNAYLLKLDFFQNCNFSKIKREFKVINMFEKKQREKERELRVRDSDKLGGDKDNK